MTTVPDIKADKFKDLFLTFSMRTLSALCKTKGWKIPSSEELSNSTFKSLHIWVIVRDEPTDNDDGTRMVLYNCEDKTTQQVNKNFKENCVVIR